MTDSRWQTIGPCRGVIRPELDSPALRGELARLTCRIERPDAIRLQEGRHLTVRLRLGPASAPLDVVVKRFGRQSLLKDRWDWRRGTRAWRAYAAALHLESRGVKTPSPVACLEHWRGRRLVTSFLLTRHIEGATSFRDELIRLFAGQAECAVFMELLETVARAIRGLHDSGCLHRDLGNQNILLGAPRAAAGGGWTRDVFFIDLNRARCGEPPSPRARGRDLSRIALPSDFRRVFLEMYWQAPPPRAFLRHERRCRAVFAWHTLTRRLRHPLRSLRDACSSSPASAGDYPAPRDQWVWDSRSGQPVPTLRPRDRHRHYHAARLPRLVAGTLPALPALLRHYPALRREAFALPTPIRHAVAVAISADPAVFGQERALARELGIRDLFVRFHHHETPRQRRERLAAALELVEEGFHLSGGLLQDRRAVRDPASWEAFCRQVLDHAGWQFDWLEFGHAINRVKWGIWGFEDYRRLLRCLPALRQDHPGIRLVGPAVNDFEFEHVLAALRELPPGCAWDALSLHLYVDRRGAPENRQTGFDTLAKFALGRAMARASGGRCADELIVSEVNWPLKGTGVYSPVGAPYESPGPRRRDPSVTEDEHADYLLRYILLATCSGLVRQTVVWRLAAHGFGLVDDRAPGGWRRRPAFQALRVWREVLSGGRFLRREPVPGADPRRVYLLRCESAAGEPLLVGWAHGAPLETAVPFRLRRACDALGVPVALRSDARLRLGARPVYAWGG